MQQPCSRCGYVSDRPARFCRQCGAPLFVENEATSAATRSYAPSQPPQGFPNQTYTPSYQAGNRWDDQAPETSQFYRPPSAPNYEPAATKKSRWGLWLLIGILCLLLVGGTIAGVVITAIRTRNAAPFNTDELTKDIERQVEEQIRLAQEQALEQAKRAVDAGGNLPPLPPLPPAAPGTDLPPGFEKYKYPNAEVEQLINVIGNEIIKMTTNDSPATVADFYRKVAGQPTIKNKEDEGEKYIFQITGPPSLIITVGPNREDPERTEIIVLRSSFKIPKLN